MKTCIFLTYLGFIELVFCTNITENELYPTCPVTQWRRKRAILEYTRWRSNIETTSEFIVKVLDDEVSTSATKPVLAINIQPVTRRGEKIIIGGAMVPKPTTATSPSDQLKDYTRFVPPTTPGVERLEDELYLAPALTPAEAVPLIEHFQAGQTGEGSNRKEPSFPKVDFAAQHAERDDSPPASPQFLPRAQLVPRQYAPVAPVAFGRPNKFLPVTPPQDSNKEIVTPTLTPPLPKLGIPERTTLRDYDIFQHFAHGDVGDELSFTRSTTANVPRRTPTLSLVPNFAEEDSDIVRPSKPTYESGRKEDFESYNTEDRTTEKESDMLYHNIFMYDDYKDGTSKTSAHYSGDSYEDVSESKTQEENDVPEKNPEPVDRDTESAGERVATAPSGQLNIEHTTEASSKFYVEHKEDEYQNTSLENADKEDVNEEIIFTDSLKNYFNGTDKRRPVCDVLKIRQLDFNSPRTLPEIVTQLKQWAEESPVARWVDITDGNFTTMENPIYMMIVDDPSSGQIISAKQTVMVVAGIQGRDHYAVAAAMYLLYQLIERSEAHTDLLTKYRFWIIPVFNPDGYDYSMTFPHRREWSKNLRQSWETCKGRESCRACAEHGLRCTVQPCYGVNLDRNFEYQWIPTEELRAEHPCGALYAGTRQLSEDETRALTQYLHDQHAPLFTFIAFKEGSVLGVMYPYSHTQKKRAFDHVYRQRASRAAAAAYSISGRPFVAGQTSEFLPLYAGGVEDWVDGHLGIDNTYTIMLFRPTDSYHSKLITERVVHEAYAATDTLLLQSTQPPSPQTIKLTQNRAVKKPPILLTPLTALAAAVLCS